MGTKHSKTKKAKEQHTKTIISSIDNSSTTHTSCRQTTVITRTMSCQQDMITPPPTRKASTSSMSMSWRRTTIRGRGPLLNQMQNNRADRVKKNYKRHDLTCALPVYNTFGKVRGRTLILNNIHFLGDPLGEYTRNGADVDEAKLMDLFEELGLNPVAKQDKTVQQMMKAMTQFAGSLKDVDMSIVVIMSHGVGSPEKVTEILGTDGKRLIISSILEIFSAQNCRAMRHKPKIFIFQCCRGYFEPMDQHDAVPMKQIIYEDILLAFATSPGYVAYRNSHSGSYYIQALCEVFREYAQDMDVVDMLVKVQDTLEKIANRKQFCSSENYSFKKCYLHPM